MAKSGKDGLLEEISSFPVIDSHEHQLLVPSSPDPRFPSLASSVVDEPISFLVRGYFLDDLFSAGATETEISMLRNPQVTTSEKWPHFKRLWDLTSHTAYANEVRTLIFQITRKREVNLESIDLLRRRLRPIQNLDRHFSSLNIKAVLVDPWWWGFQELDSFLSGKTSIPSSFRMVVPLPFFHFHPGEGSNQRIKNLQWIRRLSLLAQTKVTSLGDYLEAVFGILKRMKEQGAVAIKDQSAYFRSLDYRVESREAAERLFSRCLADESSSLGWPEAKPLDDFLFHEYMGFAAELELPVQVHTGILAGGRNDVTKANASLLTNVINLHEKVTFDLFHGNWPYMGDPLFLCKNYPNANLNLSWVHAMDPPYAVEMLTRAVYAIPHSKLVGFGGDYHYPELVENHLSMARKHVSAALSRLVDDGWLLRKEALEIASDWLYNNPNRLYKLGLETFRP